MKNFLFLLAGIALILPRFGESQNWNKKKEPEAQVNQQPNNVVKLTSIEKQAIQTRTYDADEVTALRAILSVFQNNMYENVNTDSVLGLITATLPFEAIVESEEKAGQRMAAGMFLGLLGTAMMGGYESGAVTRSIQATAEKTGENKTSVRLVLKETTQIYKGGAFGGGKHETTESDLTNQPEIYQNLFEQIDKEIFVRLNR